jgi:hypothetical protein
MMSRPSSHRTTPSALQILDTMVDFWYDHYKPARFILDQHLAVHGAPAVLEGACIWPHELIQDLQALEPIAFPSNFEDLKAKHLCKHASVRQVHPLRAFSWEKGPETAC